MTEILDKTMHISPKDVSELNHTLLVRRDDSTLYHAKQYGVMR